MRKSTNFNGLATASRSDVVNVFNYLDALHEYLDERRPDTTTELLALQSLRELLKNLLAGKQMTGPDVSQIVSQTYKVFGNTALIQGDTISSSSQQELCVPEWCIQKLFEGMAKLGLGPP